MKMEDFSSAFRIRDCDNNNSRGILYGYKTVEGEGMNITATWGVTTLLEVEPKYTSTGAYDIYTIHYSSRLSICMDEVCNNLLFAWNKYLLCRRHSYNGNSSR